jgi:FKBP-type peptidyl-prolyl cis-trans isomerase
MPFWGGDPEMGWSRPKSISHNGVDSSYSFFSFGTEAGGRVSASRVSAMKFRTALVGLSLSLAWGCGQPDIIPATPPGVELPRIELTESEQAVANGEGGMPGAESKSRGGALVEADNPPTEPGKFGFVLSGMKYTTVKPGTGKAAKTGQKVTIDFVATVVGGKEFENTRKKGAPVTFVLGAADTPIKGWNEGVAGMLIGEVRKVVLPPQLAYGTAGNQFVPPSTSVEFEIELLRAE